MTLIDKAEKTRRNTLTHDEQMREAEASCVPCKLCGGRAKIEDAGPGWGYVIGCENYGRHKNSCYQYGARMSGWAYNVADRWNELNALAALPADVAGVVEDADQMIDFLSGQDNIDGMAFGDPNEKGHRFWWRKHLSRFEALIALATAQAAQIAGLEQKVNGLCDLYSQASDQVQSAGAALAAERAKVAKLVEALKPFADYMADGGDNDDKGEPLPDTEGMGWVYLTVGDFRRACAAITEAGQ